MELLCIKHRHNYIRLLEEGYQLTDMNRASVYPLSEVEKVRTSFRTLGKELDTLKIVKLTILEEDFEQ
ncbi:MAG: hypothetical protein KAR40_03900 [Candidatus Sabulitectum sp.]|nr:hypothetical protein [Candidatus Sabulitectum sp.]